MDLGQALSGLAKPVSGNQPLKKVVDLNNRGKTPVAKKVVRKPLITPGGKQ